MIFILEELDTMANGYIKKAAIKNFIDFKGQFSNDITEE